MIYYAYVYVPSICTVLTLRYNVCAHIAKDRQRTARQARAHTYRFWLVSS